MIRTCRKAILPLFRAGALVAGMITGYYHRVFAGSCFGGPDTYFCSGGAAAGSDLTLTPSGSPLTVTTQSGFGINTSTSGGNAFTLTGNGGLTFTDTYASSITGATNGIYAKNSGGVLSITTSGTVVGTAGDGIYSFNSSTGTDLNITTTGYVNGGTYGIKALNSGTGALSVSTSGNVYSRNMGIMVRSTGTDLNITASGYVYGGTDGIFAVNSGSGSFTISTNGIVTGGVDGINAFNNVTGTNLNIGTTGIVYGYAQGIRALNNGSGALSVSTSGRVIGGRYGIYAYNFPTGTNLNITTTGYVYGGYLGIAAINKGSGGISISASGMVVGGYLGIGAKNYSGNLSITAGNVSGGYDGIQANNFSGGSLTITTSGTVTGATGAGIYTYNAGGPINITVGAGSLVQGGGAGIYAYAGPYPGSGQPITITVNGQVQNISGSPTDYAIIADGGPVTVNLNAGSVTTGIVSLGSFGDSINLAGTLNGSARMGAGDDLFLQYGGSVLTGTADGGDGIDTLGFFNMGRVDGSLWGTQYINFENLAFYGGGITLTGTWDLSGTTTVYSGNLYVNGRLTTSLLTVKKGGLLGGTGIIDGDLDVYGTLSPGHSIGTLTVGHSVHFMPGSTFIVELAADGRNDLLKAGGSVSINGGTIAAYLEPTLYPDGTNWHIITAGGGINGRFLSIRPNFTSYTIALEPVYTAEGLDLVIDRTPYAAFAANSNQAAVGLALNEILPSAQGNMANLLMTMDFAMDPSQLRATLEGVNPEILASFAPSGFWIAGSFSSMAALRQQELYWDSITAGGDRNHLWSVWGRAVSSRLDQDSDKGISGYTLDTAGAVFGMDRAFGPMLRAGLALGYSSSDLSWDDPDDSGQVTGKHIEVYGSYRYKDFSFDGRLGYTSLDNSSYRFVETPFFNGRAGGSFGSRVVRASLTGGYDLLVFDKVHVVPTANIDYGHLDQDGFNENGLGDFALHIQRKAADLFTGGLGVRLMGLLSGNTGWRFLPSAGASLVHRFTDDSRTLTANFADYPDSGFTVVAAGAADNELKANLGLSVDYNRNLSLYLNYEATLADGCTNQMLSGGMVWWF